jgi:hypothetical protein
VGRAASRTASASASRSSLLRRVTSGVVALVAHDLPAARGRQAGGVLVAQVVAVGSACTASGPTTAARSA